MENKSDQDALELNEIAAEVTQDSPPSKGVPETNAAALKKRDARGREVKVKARGVKQARNSHN